MRDGEPFTLINALDTDALRKNHIAGSMHYPVDQPAVVQQAARQAGTPDARAAVYCANQACPASASPRRSSRRTVTLRPTMTHKAWPAGAGRRTLLLRAEPVPARQP